MCMSALARLAPRPRLLLLLRRTALPDGLARGEMVNTQGSSFRLMIVSLLKITHRLPPPIQLTLVSLTIDLDY